MYKLFGFEPNSVVPTLDLMRSVVHPEDRGKFEMSVGFAANRSALRIDYRLIRPDGTLRWVTGKSQIHFLRDGSPKLLLGVVVDHTDHHEQQNKLNIEETYIKLVSAHLGGHRWLADSQGKMLDLSVWKSVTGAEPDAASDWSQRLAAVHPADRKQYSNAWRTSLSQHVAFEAVYRCKTNDGRYRRIFSRALPVLDETGKSSAGSATRCCWVTSRKNRRGQKRSPATTSEPHALTSNGVRMTLPRNPV